MSIMKIFCSNVFLASMDGLSKLLAGKLEFPKKSQSPVIFLNKLLSKFDHVDIIVSLLVNVKHQEIIISFL